jgi:hypothetical protein
MLKVCCPDQGIVCDSCARHAALVLEFGSMRLSENRFRLCKWHLRELAFDAPTLLEELLGCLVELVKTQSAAAAREAA